MTLARDALQLEHVFAGGLLCLLQILEECAGRGDDGGLVFHAEAGQIQDSKVARQLATHRVVVEAPGIPLGDRDAQLLTGFDFQVLAAIQEQVARNEDLRRAETRQLVRELVFGELGSVHPTGSRDRPTPFRPLLFPSHKLAR